MLRIVACSVAASSGLASPAFAAGDEGLSRFADSVSSYLSWQNALSVVVVAAFVLAIMICILNAMQLAVRRQLRRTASINSGLEYMQEGLLIADAENRVVFCNSRYLELYRLSRADIRVGMSVKELLAFRRAAGTLHREPTEQLVDSGPSQYLRTLQDGRSMMVSRQTLPDGGWIAMHEDFTEQRTLSRELSTTKNFLASIINHMPLAVAAKTIHDGRYVLANDAFLSFNRMERDSVIGHTSAELFSPARAENILANDQAALGASEGAFYTEKLVENCGQMRLLASRRVVIRNSDNEPEIVVALFDDVTERQAISRELEQTKQFLETIVDNLPIALTVKRAKTREFVLVNRSAETFLSKSREEIIGHTADQIFDPAMASVMDKRDDVAIAARVPVVQESPVMTPEGSRLLMWRRMAVRDDQGDAQYLIQTSEDITDRRQTESRMAHMAFHDTLTDLPNRAAFIQALSQMIEACNGTDDEFAVLYINLDRFKEINDVFGHAYGDRLLVEVSRRLRAASMGAVIARISGDEFGLIIDGQQPKAGRDLAEDLIRTLGDEFVINGRAMHIGLTVGIAIYPQHGDEAATLLANAAAALFRAKADSRGSALVFEAKTDLQTRERRAMHQELANAIKNGELCLHYQPQANTARHGNRGLPGAIPASCEIIGFEALVRWNHPLRGAIAPSLFIPLSEESGLIAEMGEWILREACREAASWSNPLQIAVNLSPAQFLQGDVALLVHSVLLETGLMPGRLELEITEGVLIRDYDRGLSLLRRLKALGVRIAMDDFGTGYSSLSYLQSFPFDKIKIDRGFTTKIGSNPQSAAIIRAVIGLGHGLDIPIVAEGVETAAQLEFLAGENCDQVQGYFIGHPRPIAEYVSIVGDPASEGEAQSGEKDAADSNRKVS